MDVVCRCAACGTQFKVDSKYSGKKAKCPKCATVLVVPDPDDTGDISRTQQINTSGVAGTAPIGPSAEGKRGRFLDSQLTQASLTAPDLSHVQQPETKTGATPLPAAPAPLKPSERLLSKNAAKANSAPNINLNAAATGGSKSVAAEKRPTPNFLSKISPMVWVAGGGVLALLLVVGVILAVVFASAKKPVLTVTLSDAERASVSFVLDKKKIKLPKTGPVRFELEPGNHRLVLQRHGFEQIEYGFDLKTGDELKYQPEWVKNVLALNNAPASTGGGTGTKPTSNFPKFDPNAPNADLTPGPQGYPGWLQLIDVAKRQAAEKKLDILMVFASSDRTPASIHMANEIFSNARFLESAKRRFVLLVIDMPSTAAGQSVLADVGQNQFLLRQFEIEKLPTIVLLDANGLPYATDGFFEKGVDEYLNHLNLLASNHGVRDDLIQKGKQTLDPGQKLAFAEQTLAFLRKQTVPKGEARMRNANSAVEAYSALGLAKFYPSLMQEWLRIARRLDDKNIQGKLELFFEADWRVRLANASDDRTREAIALELAEWNKTQQFQDQDRGAIMHIQAAAILGQLGKQDESLGFLQLATKFSPQNQRLAADLAAVAKLLKTKDQISSGTGFIVEKSGYLLTNHHVVSGPGSVVVRRPDTGEEIPAVLIAQDEKRDVALLKVDPEKFRAFEPITISSVKVGRGSRVAMFGYPLGDAIGAGLKFSQGGISGLPDESNDQMLLIDGRVNPGNSGGPLCNPQGVVVGMVTAKSTGGDGVDSYGMAIPAQALQDFLQKHLPNYQAPEPNADAEVLEWDAVDRRVSQSVLMILKVRK